MGSFRIEIQGVGGHGCQREVKSGDKVAGCGSENCPDCLAREFVKQLASKGMLSNYGTSSEPGNLVYAKLIHWPYGHGTVTDDLLTGVRSGNF